MAIELQPPAPAARVLNLVQVELRTVDWNWPFARDHSAAIADAWQRRLAASPRMFDGGVYLARDYAIEAGRLVANLFRTDFKTFIYWRDHADREADHVHEAFGVSLIRSAEGHVLLGRQAPGNVNSGRVYPPCGVIDDGDVDGGVIDIDASVARELREETGLGAEHLQRRPGYLVAMVGRQIAIAVEWRCAEPAEELRARVLRTLHAQRPPELDDMVIVRRQAEIDPERVPAFAQLLLRSVLPA